MIFAVCVVPLLVMSATLVLAWRERKANGSTERLRGILKLGILISFLSLIVGYLVVYLLFIKYFA